MNQFELEAILNQYFNQYKNQWEQVRFISYVTASCQSTKQLAPQDIIKFDWEKEVEKVSPEEIEKRKKELLDFATERIKNND